MNTNLKIGIHKDFCGRIDPYLKIYELIMDHNSINHIHLEASQPDFWKIVTDLDLIIFHWVYIDRDQQMGDSLIPVIEKELNIKCFPNWDTFWHYNNKIKQYYLLKSSGFSVIESYIFWEKDEAFKWLENANFPIVFKLSRGALSKDVILIDNKKQAEKLILKMFGKGIKPGCLDDFIGNRFLDYFKKFRHKSWVFRQKLFGRYIEYKWVVEKNYVLLQNFLPHNSYTIRITIIGNRAFGFNIKTVEGDFRAYDMQQVDVDPGSIDIECVKIAFRISDTFKFQCMAYDFLYDENKHPQICEMGYTSYALDIYNCSGYWDPDLNWHEGHYWPQYFQLIDLLEIPDLKQPQIDFDLVRR